MTAARIVSKSEHLHRVALAIEGNDVFALSGARIAKLIYATPVDEQIAAVEYMARLQLRSARRFQQSARRWLARGLTEQAQANFHYAKVKRESALALLNDRRRLVRERDAAFAQAAE